MEKKIIILLVGMLSCPLAVFAQTQPQNTVDIEINSDTTIVVRDLFGAGCKLYGDKILLKDDMAKELSSTDGKHKDLKKYTVYGGEGKRFDKRIKELNSDNSQYIFNDNSKGICIRFSYSEMPDTTFNIRFYSTTTHNNVLTKRQNSQKKEYWGADGWCPDTLLIYSVKVKKVSQNESGGTDISVRSDEVPKNPNIASNNYETIKQEIDNLRFNLYDEIRELRCALVIAGFTILFFIIVIFIRINKLNKKTEKFKIDEKQYPLESKEININKIKQTVISQIQPKDLVQRISNEDIYNVVNRSDIQLYIQNIIAGKVEDYLRNKVNISIPSNNSDSHQQPLVVQPELRTTKIEYLPDNNCFIISENSQNKIFEIYSTNGEYYYTIVNDASIKKEMLGFITAFSGYVETRQDSPIPSTVEVLRDGRLIKNGDMYIIDTTSILQVSLK